jgi:hypothetical protein
MSLCNQCDSLIVRLQNAEDIYPRWSWSPKTRDARDSDLYWCINCDHATDVDGSVVPQTDYS